MSRTLRRLVGFAVLVLAACGDGGTEPPSGSPTLSVGADTMLLLDEQHRVLARALDAEGRAVRHSSIAWTSSAPAVVSVDGAGSLTAHALGAAVITATLAGGVTDAMSVTVAPHFKVIAPGGTHTCGITGRDEVYCWGIAARGELGPAPASFDCSSRYSPGTRCSPVPIPSLGVQADTIVAGGRHTCALDAQGAAWCWGANFYGQAGTGSNTDVAAAARVVGGHAFVELTAGRMHTCGITAARDAYCWGWDGTGQLGAGDVSSGRCSFFSTEEPCSTSPRRVVGGLKWARLSAAEKATCGLTMDGDAFCWGLGVDASDGMYCEVPDWLEGCSRTPVRVEATRRYRAVSIGEVHRCLVGLDDTLDCWGANFWGMLGTGDERHAFTLIRAAGGAAFASFHAGRAGNCALANDGRAHCWGYGDEGAIGDGRTAHAHVPTAVAGQHTFAWLAAGSVADHYCALADTGRAYCWGHGKYAQLGDGGYESRSTPSLVRLVARAP